MAEHTSLERATRELALRKGLQEALLVFSRALSARLPLESALAALARELNALLGTARTSIWLHDRNTHSLALGGSSDDRHDQSHERLSTSDDGPIARGLRQYGALVSGKGTGHIVVAPLRGWRRALGTLAIEGEPREVNDGLLVELALDAARQLSIAVENVVALDELIRQQTRLAQAGKLAALGQFVAGIAHEMNNPLQSVLGHLELMLRDESSSGAQAAERAQLQRIYDDAERAAKIVSNLLVFGGTRRAVRQPLDVAPLLERVAGLRRTAMPRPDVEFVVHADDVVPRLSGDAELLERALLNIVVNAEQAIAETRRSGRVTLSAASDGRRVLISVDDTGPGIPPEILPKIFDPFFTTKDVGRGTGLGLAIVYGIVQDHGGSVQASVATGGGARFTLDLPAF